MYNVIYQIEIVYISSSSSSSAGLNELKSFFFRNKIASAVLGDKRFLNLLMMIPIEENTLSDGVEVAGTHRMLLTRLASAGSDAAFSFHHCNGLIPIGSCGSARYFSKSSSSFLWETFFAPIRNDIASIFILLGDGISGT